jgi:hypothetical protein
MKRVTGRPTLHIADFLRWVDTKEGGQSRASDAVKKDIAAYFESDNARLERRIWRPRSP